MSVSVRFRDGRGWEVDIILLMPDGQKIRERRKAPVSSRSAALRWGQARERELLMNGLVKPRRVPPTLAEFAPRFVEGWARANRHKPSGVAAKETILRVHLVPFLGSRRLDEITDEHVQRLKSHLAKKARSTSNNILSVLSKMLKVAVEWGEIERMPCSIHLLPIARSEAEFHDFEEYEWLVGASREVSAEAHLIVLLGGEAGLRCGEMMALEWTDVDFRRDRLKVERSEWKGHVTAPKGGRPRFVPMTARLGSTLRTHRHLRSPRVLCRSDDQPLTQKIVRNLVLRAARLANLANRSVHVLRHTYCSHLAMAGVPARSIQELAGHADLSTTQRYMHLSPRAVDDAVRMLENAQADQGRGAIVERASERRNADFG
ncbi:MAG: site-specific integrase [Gemmatimonadetes bacterium]|nr:site-specific integrase [Gemmatimonadota bacterium]